jgi:hypothetical protein
MPHGKRTNRNHTKWQVHIQQLIDFKREFGHLRVPYSNGLYKWISCIRSYRRKSAPYLSSERVKQLDELGFEWEPARYSRRSEADTSSTSSSDKTVTYYS